MTSRQKNSSTNPSSGGYHGEKLIYPAANRNKEPILGTLKQILYEPSGNHPNMTFLEISSGSGQHIAHFAPHFEHITFYPSEVDNSFFGSIGHYIESCPTKNIKPPVVVDIRNNMTDYGFEENYFDYIYNANMMHISEFECTKGLFCNAGEHLKVGGLLICYGPFGENGVITPESNIAFDKSLRAQNPQWGIRDLADLSQLAHENGLCLTNQYQLPANNKIIVFKNNSQG